MFWRRARWRRMGKGMSDTAVVGTYGYRHEAEFARGTLKAAGIEAVLLGADGSGRPQDMVGVRRRMSHPNRPMESEIVVCAATKSPSGSRPRRISCMSTSRPGQLFDVR